MRSCSARSCRESHGESRPGEGRVLPAELGEAAGAASGFRARLARTSAPRSRARRGASDIDKPPGPRPGAQRGRPTGNRWRHTIRDIPGRVNFPSAKTHDVIHILPPVQYSHTPRIGRRDPLWLLLLDGTTHDGADHRGCSRIGAQHRIDAAEVDLEAVRCCRRNRVQGGLAAHRRSCR